MTTKHYDVLIIGAGISGISAAYHLQTYCPNKSYAILEGRKSIGGTWDLFRFPGIRSDSEMYTLGFSFKEWKKQKTIAHGSDILDYLKETVDEFGIDKHIQFEKRVEKIAWSSDTANWTVSIEGSDETFSCNFLMSCTGYYNYEEGYTPDFPTLKNFKGTVAHPQKWNDSIDYEGKKVVVIGSGATAVTMVPVMAEKAEHVTMLQRSPTYMIAGPDEDAIGKILNKFLPFKTAYRWTRKKNIWMSHLTYNLCRKYPNFMKKVMIGGVKKELGDDFEKVEKDFTPNYNPWDQRVCLVRNGDFFEQMKAGKASVKTDHIDTFTERGIKLKRGEELEADVIVTATGLQLQVMGKIQVFVDGQELDAGNAVFYKSAMVSDVPNMSATMGYTNLSWALKCDLVNHYVCRLLNYMDKNNYDQCVASIDDPSMEIVHSVDFTSGYFMRSLDQLPKQGTKGPWTVIQSYYFDKKRLMKEKINDGTLKFSKIKKREKEGSLIS